MKGFVFDLDNTLYDRYSTIAGFITLDWERIQKYINPAYNLDRAIKHACHTEPLYIYDGWGAVYEALVTEHFFNADNTPSFKQFFDFTYNGFKKVAVNHPFTEKVLTTLKNNGYKIGLLSSSSDYDRQYLKLKLLGIREMFDTITISGEYSEQMCGECDNPMYDKPNKSIFEYTAHKLGVKPSELYYVGDNAKKDIVGAINSGYTPVWIKACSPWILQNELIPELCFDTIEGVLTLI